MNLNKLFTYLVPKDKVFHGLFLEASSNLVNTAEVFCQLVNSTTTEELVKYADTVRQLEHAGDEVTHKILLELSTNFITPFDREDIHYLTTAIDDIVDYIHGSTTRITNYKIFPATEPMKQMAEILLKQCKEIDIAIKNMRYFENIVRTREALVRINSLENSADDVFDQAIAHLFLFEKDAMHIIKYKEVLSNIETATDKCEDVANVIESIVIKVS